MTDFSRSRGQPTNERSIRSAVFAMCGGRCARCNCTLDPSADLGASNSLHVDHVVPRSLHGLDHLSNYQPLCAVCNASKGKLSVIDYRPAHVRVRYPPPSIPLPRSNDVTAASASNTASSDARRAVALMKAHGIDYVSILVAAILEHPNTTWTEIKRVLDTDSPDQILSITNFGKTYSRTVAEWLDLTWAARYIISRGDHPITNDD